MRTFQNVILIILILGVNIGCRNDKIVEQQDPESVFLSPDVMCGTVQFADGCGGETDSLLRFGLALLHHMTYDDAEYIFDQVIKEDNDCFWGHWGKAMTFIHPLWPDMPPDEKMKQGWSLAMRAQDLAKDQKQKLYCEPILAYYKDGLNRAEQERLISFEMAWKAAHEQQPDDLEAGLFYALSRLATVSPEDKSFKVQREVGAMAEEALKLIPDHPGGFHYAIHAYDVPPLADRALKVARGYGKVAPEIPHALHMPSHIFTRLGYWDESIEWNWRSANAALRLPFQGKVSLHYFHALDYIVYAYLQKAEDKKAIEILEGLDTLEGPFQAHATSAYMLAAAPVRIALERHLWDDASQIEARQPDHFPWDNFPAFEALSHFARGIGAAHIGDLQTTKASIQELDKLHTILNSSKSGAYWAKQVNIQKTSVEAWYAFAEGNHDNAIEIMSRAAQMENETEKSPLTPGEILPANELYGDMLLELNRPGEALAVYQKALERSPNRFNSLYGAGKSADLLGNTELSKKFYNQLIALTSHSEAVRPSLVQARDRLRTM